MTGKEPSTYKNIVVPLAGSPLSRKEQQMKITGFYVAAAYDPHIIEDYSTKSFVSPQQFMV